MKKREKGGRGAGWQRSPGVREERTVDPRSLRDAAPLSLSLSDEPARRPKVAALVAINNPKGNHK